MSLPQGIIKNFSLPAWKLPGRSMNFINEEAANDLRDAFKQATARKQPYSDISPAYKNKLDAIALNRDHAGRKRTAGISGISRLKLPAAAFKVLFIQYDVA